MAAVSPTRVFLHTDTCKERMIFHKEIKRCRVQYHLVYTRSDVVQADLALTDRTIVIENRDQGIVYKEILLEDFLGAEIFSTSSADVCRLEINSFPVTKLGSRNSRQVDVDEVLFTTDSPEGVKNVVVWRNALRQECERAVRKTFAFQGEAPVVENQERRYLVLINPVAGSGKGVRNFEKHVQPMFNLADIGLNIIITEYAGHAASLVKTYDLSLVNGIILCSGDGLFYEVVNALMEREDWKTAIKTPLGVIPTGTGNALCASLLLESKEQYSLANAAFQIIRGGVRPLDLSTIHAGNDVRHMAMLSCWGFVADTDIDSENWKALGKDTRYVLYSIKNIATRKSYCGRLHYLPLENEETDLTDYSADSKQTGRNMCQSEPSPKRIPLHFLPSTTRSNLPCNWKSVEGDFVLFGVLMVPLVAEGFYGYSGVRLGSGYFTICYGLDDLTRCDLLRMLITGGTGEFLTNSEKIAKVKTRAFRLEPLGSTGVITVDGEVVPYAPIQGEVHQNFIRVYSRKCIS